MTDIRFGAFSKKIIRMGAKLVMKHLKVDMPYIEQDLRHCRNKSVSAVNTILLAGANQIKPQHQRETTRNLGQLGLWILYKDTAYRDTFFWMIYQLLIRADKILPLIEPYVKEPDEWQPNLWEDSRQLTKQQQKDGKIPKHGQSMEETVFTPSVQNKRHKQILGEK